MSPDPNDELARFRARRARERRVELPQAGAESPLSPDQEAAIARAREAWLLRRHTHADPANGDDPDNE
jgi:hypothetical protein